MTWPQATDYNAAVQNPQLCFGDDDLRQGEAVGDMLGLPRPHSGNFADVYQIQGPDNQSWAVKCFTRPVCGLRPRYQAITEHLRQSRLAFMVEFHFLDEGIRIHGQWFPIVKMRWVEGFRLNDFVRDQLDKPAVLERLAQLWLRLGQELRDARMAHGDLQHGNVLLVPGSKSASLALKLIDYDGMFVPALAEQPSGEVGHANYQHPQRLREGGYGAEIDRFAHLLIYTALRCLRIGGASLWQPHDSGENLLFREEDFRQPARSRLLRELWALRDRDTRDLVGHLVLASQAPLLVAPSIEELVDGGIVRPLSHGEKTQIETLLGLPESAPRTRPVSARKRTAITAEMPAAEMLSASSVLVEEGATETATHTAALDPTAPELPRLPPPLPPARRGPPDVRLNFHPAEARKGKLDLTGLADPLVAILSRPMWLAVLGAITVLSFLAVNLLVWLFVREPPPAPVLPQPTLRSLDDATIQGGHKFEILLAVERNDCEDPLTLQVDGLPAELKAPRLELEADQDSIVWALRPPLDYELPPRPIRVSLRRNGQQIEERHFQLAVRKTPRPSLQPASSIRCRAGASCEVIGRIERNGCTEPLRLQFEGLKKGLRQESLPETGRGEPRVRLSIPADAAPEELVPLSLALYVADTLADTRALFLRIQGAAAHPLKIDKAPKRLAVKAGDKGELEIDLARGDYKGPVEVRLEGLPEGVRAAPVTVPPEASSAAVRIEAAADAGLGEAPVKIIAVPGEHQRDERAFWLEVQKGETPEKEPKERKREVVTFGTVDHVRLVGTLYPGSRGKEGACVLMLHELGHGHHRNTPAWVGLAEALQADGHTVLTFDFRGHGDSTRIARAFWENSVNHNLPRFRKTRPQDGLPNHIEFEEFSPNYLPWLIHDIAAALTFLDVRHDDPAGPVNTFNLVVLGAGQGAALGSLWLAAEGRRFNAEGNGPLIRPMPPEKLSTLRAVWIGMPAKLGRIDVRDWIRRAHEEPEVPITFIYGERDRRAAKLLQPLKKDGVIEETVTPDTDLSGAQLLEGDADVAAFIESYLRKAVDALRPQKWVRRQVKKLWSYWVFPSGPGGQPQFFLARQPGEDLLSPVPLERFDISIEGLHPQQPQPPGMRRR